MQAAVDKANAALTAAGRNIKWAVGPFLYLTVIACLPQPQLPRSPATLSFMLPLLLYDPQVESPVAFYTLPTNGVAPTAVVGACV